MNKWDWIFLIGTISVALMILFMMTRFATEGAYIVVTTDGKETARYALTEEIEENIQGVEAGYVHLAIHNGVADVTDASCPDQLCVHQARISKAGETIVCLPNRIVVRVISQEEPSYDAVVN